MGRPLNSRFLGALLVLCGLFSVAWVEEDPKGQLRTWVSGGFGRYVSDVGACEPDIRRRRYREVGGGLEYYLAQRHSVGMGFNLSRVTGDEKDVSDDIGHEIFMQPGDQFMIFAPYGYQRRLIGVRVAPGLLYEEDENGKGRLYAWGGLDFRAGPTRKAFFSLGILTPGNEVGAVTGGFANIGVGSHAFEKVYWWAGMTGVPSEEMGLGLRLDVYPTKYFAMTTMARMGQAHGFSEWGMSAGAQFRVPPSGK